MAVSTVASGAVASSSHQNTLIAQSNDSATKVTDHETRISDLESAAAQEPVAIHARYAQQGTQPAATDTEIAVEYPTAIETTAEVDPDAGFQVFTFTKAGVWTVSASVRSNFSSTGDKYVEIIKGGDPLTVYASGQAKPVSGNITTQRRFAVGDAVSINFRQTSGGSLDIIGEGQEGCSVAFTFVGL